MVNQKQESQVSTVRSMFRLSLVLPVLILIGCEGQNTFNRTTNPTKSYQGSIDKSQTWKPGMGPRKPVTDFDNRQFYCGQVFSIATAGAGNKRAEFHEGVDGAVAVTITANTKAKFSVSLEDGPKDLKIKRLTSDSDYQLTWKPTPEDAKHNTVKIVITAPELQKSCPYGLGDLINVEVDQGPGVPVLNIFNLADTIEYGPWKEFQVEIVDKGATASKPPVISETGADERMISNAESKLKNVSAKDAVFCEDGKMKNNDQTTWTYKCSFKPELLKDAESFIKTPQTINAVFFMKAKSAATGLESSQTSKSVQVVFPVLKVEEKKVEPTAAPAAPTTPVAPAAALGASVDPAPRATPLPPLRPSDSALRVKGAK